MALLVCAARYGQANSRMEMIEQYLTHFSEDDIPLETFSILSYLPSAVILFVSKLCFLLKPLDTLRCSLLLVAVIRSSLTEGSLAVRLAERIVQEMFTRDQKFIVPELADCFRAVAMTDDPALGMQFNELIRNEALCSSQYFVKFAYMLCLDLLEEKGEILLKDEESRERSLRLGKEPEETGYRRIRFLEKTVEKKDVSEEGGKKKKKKMPTEEPKFIYTATGSGFCQLCAGSSENR